MHEKTCEVCSTPFRSSFQRTRFCSDACRGPRMAKEKRAREKARREANPPVPIVRECSECGTAFTNLERGGKGRTCSPKCGQARHNRRRNERHALNRPLELFSPDTVYTGRFINKNGYAVLTTRTSAQRLEHRVVMERHLGRLLETHEHVHHLNGVRTDNRLANLELWSRWHPSGQRISDLVEHAKAVLAKYENLTTPQGD